jgi:hypothetical protein
MVEEVMAEEVMAVVATEVEAQVTADTWEEATDMGE